MRCIYLGQTRTYNPMGDDKWVTLLVMSSG